MDFKIIYLAKYEAEVCLCRNINMNGDQSVCLTSFIYNEDESEIILESELKFDSAEMAKDFVTDYSDTSAENWIVSRADDNGINLV